MAQKYIRTEYGGTVVLSNIRKGRSSIPVFGMNETYTATKVTTWYDGTPMDDSKADGSIYLKLKDTGEYFRINIPNNSELFLEKDTMAQMRALTPVEILLLKMGYYKGVRLNGYYNKGDTPKSIEYFISETAEMDDGGSIIEIDEIKLEHVFLGVTSCKYFGIKGDGVHNDVIQFQNCINKVSAIEIESGLNVKCDQDIILKSNLYITGRGFISVKSIIIPSSSEYIYIDGINISYGDDTCLKLNGTIGFNTSVKSLKINNSRFIGDGLCFDAKNARRFSIENSEFIVGSFMEYTGKSAENVISNCNIISKTTNTGIGLYSYANVDGYPEGLSINDTLFYRFADNIKIDDLYVGHFTNMYLDAGGSPRNITIDYKVRTQSLHFNNAWLLERGIDFVTLTSGQSYRSQFNNIHINALIGIGISLGKQTSFVNMDNIFIDSVPSSGAIGVLFDSGGLYNKVNNLTCEVLENIAQNRENTETCVLSNVVSGGVGSSGYYFPSGIILSNVEGLPYSPYASEIPSNTVIVAGEVIHTTDSIFLQQGVYTYALKTSGLEKTSTEGYVVLSSVSPDFIPIISIINTRNGDNYIEWMFQVKKSGYFILQLKSLNATDGLAGSLGYFNAIIINKTS